MVEARNRNVSSVGGRRFSFRHKLFADVSSICDQSPSVRHLFYNYISGRKEGNVLFNDELNTFYLRLYGVSYISDANITVNI